MPFTPRYYQTEAVDSTLDYLQEFPENHPLVVCPTGSGKSHILAMLSSKLEGRILIVSHVKEILEQDLEKLDVLLDEQIGVYSASLGRRDTHCRVTVAGVQSIFRNAELFTDVRYIIVDEAHKIPKSGQGMYIQLFSSIENCNVIGLTATPYRLGSGYLHKGEKKLFDGISYEIDIVKLIKEGYLCPLLTKNANQKLDTKKLKLQAGDFSESHMAQRFDKFKTTNAIVEELTAYKDLYKHWLIFAINIEHAEHINDALVTAGIVSEVVHSKRTAVENDYAIWSYQNRLTQCLVSIEKMTTGFDAPHTDLIALIRPTKSPVLHVQIIGRGLRPDEGKDHCLILDFSGNLDRLGPINDVYIKEPGKKGNGEAPIKSCPECNTHVPAGARICYVCGYKFPEKESSDLSSNATSSQAVKTGEKQHENGFWLNVDKVIFDYHTSKKGLGSMQVRYRCGLRTVSEYIAIGREGPGGRMAEKWWDKHTKWRAHPEYFSPLACSEAVQRARNGELYEPERIYVEEENGYNKIKSRVFSREE